jgi:hypothetical protein
MASLEQLVVEFVRKDDDLKNRAKALGPIRKERKSLYEQAKKALEEGDHPEEAEVRLSTGEKVKLKLEEKPVPLKLEFLVSKLSEILGSAPRGEEIANQIWNDRPTKPSSRLIREKGSAASKGVKRARA